MKIEAIAIAHVADVKSWELLRNDALPQYQNSFLFYTGQNFHLMMISKTHTHQKTSFALIRYLTT
jgi:hypothetical protein